MGLYTEEIKTNLEAQARNRRLILALRDETSLYKKAIGVLRSGDDRFCCLGVACDLYNPALWEGESRGGSYYFMESIYTLPEKVMDAYCFNSDDGGNLVGRGDFLTLSGLNDFDSGTIYLFPDIAKIIEDELNKALEA